MFGIENWKPKRPKQGHNCRKYNHNKYGKKVKSDNKCIVYPSGAIEML